MIWRWAVRGLKLHVLLEWLVCISSSGEGVKEGGKQKRHSGAVSVIWPSQTAVSALNSDGHAGSNRDWQRRNRRIARKLGEKNDGRWPHRARSNSDAALRRRFPSNWWQEGRCGHDTLPLPLSAGPDSAQQGVLMLEVRIDTRSAMWL